MSIPKILAFSGSIRKGSYNKRLAKVALNAAEKAGAETTFVDLFEYQMPLYCEDYEAEHGKPESVSRFQQLLKNHNGFLIASPEYNSSLTGILKNTIDWSTRPEPGERWDACWKGKIAGVLCAASGLGGRNGVYHLKTMLGTYGTYVLPQHVIVGHCKNNLTNDNCIEDDKMQHQLEAMASELVRVIRGLH
ncbi:MAG: NAD(P)H-dependent oxidoreductase [Phycisphaerales bacterium]|jgi:NAD(P)H-dependent FMN reductase|nr:NAD(P)H-dependent oxidoreductase [Phycisphaerales bacterium]